MSSSEQSLAELRGIVPAIVTPFDEAGNLDLATLAALTESLVAGGVHAIMATGGTGEFPHLDASERLEVLRTIAEAAGGRVPVIAGTATCDLRQTLRLAEDAAEAGADAIISVPPYYFPLPGVALIDYFTKLAAGSSLPLFVYNNPLYTGNGLTPQQLVELLALPMWSASSRATTTSGSWLRSSTRPTCSACTRRSLPASTAS